MATRFIDKEYGSTSTTAIANDSTGTSKIKNEPNAAGIAYDLVDGRIKFNDAGTIRGLGVTFNPGVVSITGDITITASLHAGNKPLVLNKAAGIAVTLPAATGTGNRYKFYVGTAITSNTTVVSCASGDSFFGGILINDTGDSSAAAADFWPTTNSGSVSNTLTLTANGEGSIVGDWFEIEDIATNVWTIKGIFAGVADPSTPFSHV